jgi:hypothetical protein
MTDKLPQNAAVGENPNSPVQQGQTPPGSKGDDALGSPADELTAAQAERKRLMEEAASHLKGRKPISPEERADDAYINIKL